MGKTVFTKIVEREIPAYIIYEDELVISFLDISQATKGHTLVVTKESYENIFAVPDDVLAHLIKVTKLLSGKIKTAMQASGINILNNNGSVAGQTVFHYHVHIIPRYENDNLPLDLVNNTGKISSGQYLEIRDTIVSELS